MGYTPMMQQYFAVKNQYKDCILFYRLGDFYEMFFEDAETVSKELKLTLTGRDCGMEERAPMCGVPFHSAEGYVAKLVEKGYKVAICEQMQDPAETKGIVERDVIRVVTPSTIINDSQKNNYLLSVYKRESVIGLCFLDFSTGELYATVLKSEPHQNLITELSRFMPSEALLNFDAAQDMKITDIIKNYGIYATCDAKKYFADCEKVLSEHFGGKCRLRETEVSFEAIAGAIAYVKYTQKTDINHINSVKYYEIGEFMDIDANSRRNLELTETMRTKSKRGSLIWTLDCTETPMGARRLRKWIDRPLINCGVINKRLDGVEEFARSVMLRTNVRNLLKEVTDVERIIGKIVCKTATPRDLLGLKNSISILPALSFELVDTKSAALRECYENIDKMEDIFMQIDMGIIDNPPVVTRNGGIFKEGYSLELDKLKKAMNMGKGGLAEVEARERERTGIKNLKLGFNKVFGYYIEVSKSNVDKVPEDYQRKQTLTNGERYITPELKELENTVLGAEEKSIRLEHMLFEELRGRIAEQQERVQTTARALGVLDAMASMAEVAVKYNYCRPKVDASHRINIKQGRHPVVERLSDDMFVPNDTYLNNEKERFAIITGPNMAGKSTYMRQVALITLMAQMGSFVPAAEAEIGIVDSVFTRVGASDDLASGQSTFMVEMSEVSYILKNATEKSLIIYDEIGRGTSTYDGLAIAWAVAEHTINKKLCGAKTMFATHYHELTQLENTLEGVKNYSVAIKQRGEDIIFLRKIVDGGADESYGVEVARLAGLPESIIKRARQLLRELETSNGSAKPVLPEISQEETETPAETINDTEYKVLGELRRMNLETLTPIESMNVLYKLKQKLES